MTPIVIIPRFERFVCSKHRYPDKKSAVTAINNRTKGHQRNRPGLLRAYPCPRCAGWHLTHEEKHGD